MVKAVVGDESQLNSAESRLGESGIPVQVGLAIGKLGGSKANRDYLFALIPTPQNEGLEPAALVSENAEPKPGRSDKKKSSKGKSVADSSSLMIDVEWVGEHARQVSRMLVGGLHVIGIYVWASENAVRNSTLILWQVVKAVAKAAPVYANVEEDERILVHISYSPRRWSCRTCNLDSNFTSMSFRPCDLKLTKLLSTLQTFRSTYNFDVRLALFQEDIRKANNMKKILMKAISLLADQLKSVKALLDGTLITEETISVPGGPHEIELLLPFADVKSLEADSSEEVVGLVAFSGTVFAQAYNFPRDPLLQAVEDLKADIITSLKSRLEILSEDVEEAPASIVSEDTNSNENSSVLEQDPLFSCNWSEPCSFVFPRRVLVPWLDGIFICDYLQSKETFQDLFERCEELMSMKSPPDESEIFEPEASGSTTIGTSFWGMVLGSSISSACTEGQSHSRHTEKDFANNLSSSKVLGFGSLHGAVALVVVILAVLIALITMAIGHRTMQ